MNAIILTAVLGVILMFCGVFISNKSLPRLVALSGMSVTLLVAINELLTGKSFFRFNYHEMLKFENFNLLFIVIALAAALLYLLLSGKEIEKVGPHTGEYFALIMFVMCGVSLVATFNTLLMLFIGVEIMSIPLYILTGSDKRNLKSNEAALKYFLMGSFSTGILLMGITLVYGGNANASFFIDKIKLGAGAMPVLLALGALFIMVALSFKVSAAPFHFWTPDVYDGAPTVFTSFMSTIVKVAGFFAFLRLFEHAFGVAQDQWQHLILFITLATLLIGNITAVFQQSVKRMLAYSSIAQAGFMLLAVFALNAKAKEGILLYSAAYSLATIGIFGILTKMEDYTIEGFNGLGKRNPLLAFCATVFLLSLTGVPLTAGFQAKFFMLMAAVENGHHFWIVLAAVVFAAISAYYYFRVIQAMYFKEASGEAVSITTEKSFNIILSVIVVLVLLLGIYPEFILGWLYH